VIEFGEIEISLKDILKDKLKKSLVLEQIVNDFYEDYKNNIQYLIEMLEYEEIDGDLYHYTAEILYKLLTKLPSATEYAYLDIYEDELTAISIIYGEIEFSQVMHKESIEDGTYCTWYSMFPQDDFCIVSRKDKQTLKHEDIYFYKKGSKWIKVRLL